MRQNVVVFMWVKMHAYHVVDLCVAFGSLRVCRRDVCAVLAPTPKMLLDFAVVRRAYVALPLSNFDGWRMVSLLWNSTPPVA